MLKETMSRNERTFFEQLKYKMENDNAPWEDVLISSFDNEDELSLMRLTYDEFILSRGRSREDWLNNEIHTMSLSEVLNVNLKEHNLLNRNQTLLQWLQACDYSCVRYDHSNDVND